MRLKYSLTLILIQQLSMMGIARGNLRLPAQTGSGEYVLQIVVNDDAPGGKRRTTSQWIDFEVVR